MITVAHHVDDLDTGLCPRSICPADLRPSLNVDRPDDLPGPAGLIPTSGKHLPLAERIRRENRFQAVDSCTSAPNHREKTYNKGQEVN